MKNAVTAAAALSALLLAAAPAAANPLNGFYAGVAIGAEQTIANTDIGIGGQDILSFNDFGSADAAGTITAGYDFALANRLVLGAFAEYTFNDDAEFGISSPLGFEANASVGDSWAVGARLGYAFTGNTLVYGLVAYTQADAGDLVAKLGNQTVKFSADDYTGIMVGGGIETPIAKNLYLDVRYTYSDLDSTTYNLGVAGAEVKVDPDVHAARVGLTYKLGGADDNIYPSPMK